MKVDLLEENTRSDRRLAVIVMPISAAIIVTVILFVSLQIIKKKINPKSEALTTPATRQPH